VIRAEGERADGVTTTRVANQGGESVSVSVGVGEEEEHSGDTTEEEDWTIGPNGVEY